MGKAILIIESEYDVGEAQDEEEYGYCEERDDGHVHAEDPPFSVQPQHYFFLVRSSAPLVSNDDRSSIRSRCLWFFYRNKGNWSGSQRGIEGLRSGSFLSSKAFFGQRFLFLDYQSLLLFFSSRFRRRFCYSSSQRSLLFFDPLTVEEFVEEFRSWFLFFFFFLLFEQRRLRPSNYEAGLALRCRISHERIFEAIFHRRDPVRKPAHRVWMGFSFFYTSINDTGTEKSCPCRHDHT